jgi:DNA-binding transcriptional LysR family regulator
MADYAASLILPQLAHRLEREAPGVDIRTRVNDNINALGLLDRNEIDFAIGYHTDWPERFGGQVLFTETYVCVMRRGHPLARDRITVEEFAAARHLLVTITGEPVGFVDRLLRRHGLTRHIAMTANQFLVAPLIIQNSDMIMTLALRTAERFAEINKLHIVPVPLEPDPIDLTLLWHKELIRHPAHEWMRSMLAEICRKV